MRSCISATRVPTMILNRQRIRLEPCEDRHGIRPHNKLADRVSGDLGQLRSSKCCTQFQTRDRLLLLRGHLDVAVGVFCSEVQSHRPAPRCRRTHGCPSGKSGGPCLGWCINLAGLFAADLEVLSSTLSRGRLDFWANGCRPSPSSCSIDAKAVFWP